MNYHPMPRVSVVVPVWNEEQFLYDCLGSLRTQTFTDFEVVIVNDGSTDSSRRLIDQWCAHDLRFRAIHRTNNLGIGRTLNQGFEKVNGEFQTWVSADSWVEKKFLESLVAALDSNQDAVMAYSSWHLVDGESRVYHPGPYYKKRLQRHCYLGPCWLFRREAKDRAGPYCDVLCEDYYMHLMLAEQGEMVYVPEVLGAWRNHPNNSTNRISLKTNWRESSVAKAKARWKSARYKVAYVCPDLDCAGVGWLLANGINDLSEDFAVRHVMTTKVDMTGGYDLLTTQDLDEIKEVLADADILYVNNNFPETSPQLSLPKLLRQKPNILHVHAGPIGWNAERIAAYHRQYNSKLLTCTPGHYFGQWIPNFMPVTDGPWPITNSYFYEPVERNFEAPLRLMCHHNYLNGKGMETIREALYLVSIEAHGSPAPPLKLSIRHDLKMPLWQHLLHKRDCHVCVDQLTHGYIGMASWESMAQAVAVIARIDQESLAVYRDFFGEPPPVINCRLIDDFVVWVNRLGADLDLARQIGANSRDWMLKNYNADVIVKHYESVFREVLNESVQQ